VTPEAASLRARIAAHSRWATCDDRREATSKARAAFMDRFERQVDPEGKLAPAERAKRAANARSAHFAKLAYARHHKAS
jgi:hypothetical protein